MSMMDVEGVINLNTKLVVGWVVALAAVNWGLVGLLNVDLVQVIFGGSSSVLAKAVYILVGLAGLYKLYHLTMAKK